MAVQTETCLGYENLVAATSKQVPHLKARGDQPDSAGGAPLAQTLSNSQLDQMLVARVQAGDKQAFNALVQKYQHKLFKLISRYIHDQTEALDVAQETFLKAYRALPKFRGDSGFYTWLYRIGLNTAKNHLVALGRRLPDQDIDAQEAERYGIDFRLKDHDSPEALALRDEIEHTVSLALEELPEDLRTALILRVLNGLTYEEVAQVMDCPIGTVRSRIYRARETIDKRLRPLLE
ncbi:RNA polymerase sigma factor RpoE [Nitrococcus mobilis]|uniref:RNA polymerase sigma factor n=1 Tax=Nitrococcus mobilis Nb-231 TaxID=314278 RepID=A4BQP3_9GAMM|nr:RNA polymerase sigma factor RpoE [Nitrococcus mobilis]EAR21893.1 RNA polymerase sigma-70 factor [Nitrococcus mobilis Nb-231]